MFPQSTLWADPATGKVSALGNKHDAATLPPPAIAMVAFVVLLATNVPLWAEPVLYWPFDDGTVDAEVTTVQDQADHDLDGKARSLGGSGGATYSSDVPAAKTFDGKEGAVLNGDNTASIELTFAGKANNVHTGDRLAVGDDPQLRSRAFTFEMFIKVNERNSYSSIAGKGFNWSIDLGAAGRLRIRVDNAEKHNQSVRSLPVGGVIDDGKWHHVALTYEEVDQGGDGDDVRGRFALFKNYQKVAQSLIRGAIDYTDAPLTVGNSNGRGIAALVDEVRYSDEVLTPDRFSYAPGLSAAD